MDFVEQNIIIDAPPEKVFEVVTDYESYPDFLDMVVDAEILDKPEDNVVICRFEVRIIKTFSYTLRLVHYPYEKTEWTYVEGAFKDNRGGWEFIPLDDGTKTKAIYKVAIDFGFAVPKMIANMLVNSSLPSMLKAFKKRIESM